MAMGRKRTRGGVGGTGVVPFRGRRWGALWGATGKGKGGSSASYPVHLSLLPLMSIAVLPPLPTLRKTGCGPVHALAPKYESAKTTGVVSVVCGRGGSERRSRRRHPPWLWLPAFEELGRRCTAQWHTGVHGGSWGTRAYTREAYKDTDTWHWTRVGRGPTKHRWESNERPGPCQRSNPTRQATRSLHRQDSYTIAHYSSELVQVKGKIWQETPAQATWFALGSHLARW